MWVAGRGEGEVRAVRACWAGLIMNSLQKCKLPPLSCEFAVSALPLSLSLSFFHLSVVAVCALIFSLRIVLMPGWGWGGGSGCSGLRVSDKR